MIQVKKKQKTCKYSDSNDQADQRGHGGNVHIIAAQGANEETLLGRDSLRLGNKCLTS